MRLVYGDTAGPEPTPMQGVEIGVSVRKPHAADEILQIVLTVRPASVAIDRMKTAVAMTAQDAPEMLGPVAGRIAHQETDLEIGIASWLDDMRARRKKPRSIEAFREVMERARRECGWSRCSDLTFLGITTWLASKAWKGTTYNRNLSVFRSACAHMTRAKFLEADPLETAVRADDDGGDGARAATLEEARLMIRQAWIREQSGDRRVKGAPALYLLCLFAAACRAGEPEQWRRKHLVLDASVPHILWTREIQKSGNQAEVSLCPELVALLRIHMHGVDSRLRAEGRAPSPEDFVFVEVPTKHTFKAIRDRAGIAAQDRRGRAFTAHSARKFFATELTGQGIAEKMVDRLMRHAGKVEHRYYDPSLDEQAFAVSKLPALWPLPVSSPKTQGAHCGQIPTEEKSLNSGLTSDGVMAEHEGVAVSPLKTSSRSVPISGPCPTTRSPRLEPEWGPELATEPLRKPGRGSSKRSQVGPPKISIPAMPSIGLITGVDPTDLADLLESLARVIRGRDQGHGQQHDGHGVGDGRDAG
jgi:integrase